MCNHVCKQITLLLAAILIAHLIPKESHWRFSGRAIANSFLKWSPEPGKKIGMIHFHVIGDGYLEWENTKMPLENHTFFHIYGKFPNMKFVSDKGSVKAEAHLFV